MSHAGRTPKRLAEKLRQIRKALGLSQREMAQRLGIDITPNNISRYERAKTAPTLTALLAYTHLAKVPMEQIVDDDLHLNL